MSVASEEKPKRPRAKVTPPPLDIYVTPKQVAESLGLSRRHLRRMVSRGEYPPPDLRFGRSVRWLVATHERWLARWKGKK